MISLRRIRNTIFKKTSLLSHGSEGVQRLGHRGYVGGRWEEIGKLQFEFLVRRGLSPRHRLLDIGCGSLRAGVHFIPFLDVGHYMGLDKERELLAAGINRELGHEMYVAKAPLLYVNDDFKLQHTGFRPTHALAHSLFTHLPPPMVAACFRELRCIMDPRGIFFATFFEAAKPVRARVIPHDHRLFAYTRTEIMDFGARSGWTAARCRDWQHPRGQVMFEYRPC